MANKNYRASDCCGQVTLTSRARAIFTHITCRIRCRPSVHAIASAALAECTHDGRHDLDESGIQFPASRESTLDSRTIPSLNKNLLPYVRRNPHKQQSRNPHKQDVIAIIGQGERAYPRSHHGDPHMRASKTIFWRGGPCDPRPVVAPGFKKKTDTHHICAQEFNSHI